MPQHPVTYPMTTGKERWIAAAQSGLAGRWRGRLSAACCALSLVAAPVRADEAAGQRADRVGRIEPDGALAELVMRRPPAELAQAVAELGIDAWEPLFEALVDGRYAVRAGEGGRSFRRLDEPRRAALLAAVGLLPYDLVRERLIELQGSGIRERLVAVEMLVRVARSEDLELLVRLCEPLERELRVDRRLRDAFGPAFTALLEREPRVAFSFVLGVSNFHPSLIAPALAALAAAPAGRHALPLAKMLGPVPEADALILVELGRAIAVARKPLDEGVWAALQAYLTSDDEQLAVEAAGAVAKLQDRRAVPILIDLLDSQRANVVSRAHAALIALSGKRIQPVREPWSSWHQAELAWWEAERHTLAQRVLTASPAEVARLVLELSKRSLFRHELTPWVAQLLQREDAELVALACATLGHLGSDTSIEPLLALLDSSRENELRAAAWRALKRVTGSELGPDPELWRQALAF